MYGSEKIITLKKSNKKLKRKSFLFLMPHYNYKVNKEK